VALQLTVVDAFTSIVFAGNPAAVAVLDAFPLEERMQNIASEMNLAETAFVVSRGADLYDLRWFTPTVEVDLCGHATLASAHVLGGSARFQTRSGILECSNADGGWIEMDFPSDPPYLVEQPAWFTLADVRWFGRGKFDYLIEVSDADFVRQFVPDLAMLARLGSRSVIVTALAVQSEFDFVSRVFCPNAGIAEDPVMGSAHCTLAAFWGDRIGRDALIGEQASSRGGVVRMRRKGDRVVLAGQAVTVSHVELFA
jgi:predicted PhzF superfamily epimerase YddE/YHI9